MTDSGWSVDGIPVDPGDDYTDTVTHLRVFDEGDGWALDAADDYGHYSPDIWKYDTREEAVSHAAEFVEHLKQENYTLNWRGESAPLAIEGQEEA